MEKPTKRDWLSAVIGLAAGASAAWGWQVGRSDRSSVRMPSVPAVTAAIEESGSVAGRWELLLREKGYTLQSRLQQAELAARAGSRDMPQILALAGENRTARELLLRRWAEMDPEAAASWLAASLKLTEWKGPDDEDQDVKIVYSVWAQKDPAAAMASLKAQADLNLCRLWTGSILEKMLDEDMSAGVKFGVLSGPGMSLSKVFYRSASPEWVKMDPARAAALLAAEPPGEFRDAHLGEAIDALAKTDLSAAIGLMLQHQGQKAEWVPEELFREWAGKDSAALTAWLNSGARPWQKNAIKAALASSMGEKDPVAALQWSSQHLAGQNREQVQSGILTKLAQSDPAAALSWLDSLSEGTALRHAVAQFSRALPDSSPEALLSNAQSLPDGAARTMLTAKVYEKMYQKDPDGLLTSLASQPASALPDGIWAQLGENTPSTEEGLKRAAALPSEAMPEYLKAVFRQNIKWHDTAKFTVTMAGVKDPALRAAAIEGAMENLAWLDAAPMAAWARTLPAAERRLVAGQMILRLPRLTTQQKKELIEPLQ